jgi:hypothetical protein
LIEKDIEEYIDIKTKEKLARKFALRDLVVKQQVDFEKIENSELNKLIDEEMLKYKDEFDKN